MLKTVKISRRQNVCKIPLKTSFEWAHLNTHLKKLSKPSPFYLKGWRNNLLNSSTAFWTRSEIDFAWTCTTMKANNHSSVRWDRFMFGLRVCQVFNLEKLQNRNSLQWERKWYNPSCHLDLPYIALESPSPTEFHKEKGVDPLWLQRKGQPTVLQLHKSSFFQCCISSKQCLHLTFL